MNYEHDVYLRRNFSGATTRRFEYPSAKNYQNQTFQDSRSIHNRRFADPSYHISNLVHNDNNTYFDLSTERVNQNFDEFEDDSTPPPPPAWPAEIVIDDDDEEDEENGNEEDEDLSGEKEEKIENEQHKVIRSQSDMCNTKEKDKNKAVQSFMRRQFLIADTDAVMGKISEDRQSIFINAWKKTVTHAILSGNQQVQSPAELFDLSQFKHHQFRLNIKTEALIPFVHSIVNQLPSLWKNVRFRMIETTFSRRATILFTKDHGSKYKSCGEILDIFARENCDLCVDKWIINHRTESGSGEFFIFGIDQDSAKFFSPQTAGRLFFLKSPVRIKICGKHNKNRGLSLGERRKYRSIRNLKMEAKPVLHDGKELKMEPIF